MHRIVCLFHRVAFKFWKIIQYIWSKRSWKMEIKLSFPIKLEDFEEVFLKLVVPNYCCDYHYYMEMVRNKRTYIVILYFEWIFCKHIWLRKMSLSHVCVLCQDIKTLLCGVFFSIQVFTSTPYSNFWNTAPMLNVRFRTKPMSKIKKVRLQNGSSLIWNRRSCKQQQ